MKKTIFALCSFLLVLGTASAQTATKQTTEHAKGHHPRLTVEERAKHRTDNMNQQCKLSADQAKRILQINIDFFTKKDNVVKSPEAKDAIRALAKERNKQEQSVLTPEQAAIWKAYLTSQKNNNDGKGKVAAPTEKGQED